MLVLFSFAMNIAFYGAFPLYLTSLSPNIRVAAFYIYLGVVLVIGGIAGAVYAFPLSDDLVISGGNLAYGAFMMTTIMLIVIERDVATFRRIMLLVALVDIFMFAGLHALSAMIDYSVVLNPFHIPVDMFFASLWILIVGCVLLLLEILFLLFIFLQSRKYISNLGLLSNIYTLAFIVTLCADGVIFPLLAFGFSPNLTDIMFGTVYTKLVLASCYSVPLILFYLIYHKAFAEFVGTPIEIKNLVWVSRKRLIDQIQRYEARDQRLRKDNQELLQLSNYDMLTGLANRRNFENTLEASWARCLRNQVPLTLVMGDVDYFKQYNDTYGHRQGDRCLVKLTQYWGQAFNRPTDLAARIGGEEFAFILPDVSTEQIIPKLHRFMEVLREANIPHSQSAVAPYVTMSLGVAGVIPNPETSSEMLIQLADQRLYKAKDMGRNQIVMD